MPGGHARAEPMPGGGRPAGPAGGRIEPMPGAGGQADFGAHLDSLANNI